MKASFRLCRLNAEISLTQGDVGLVLLCSVMFFKYNNDNKTVSVKVQIHIFSRRSLFLTRTPLCCQPHL